MKRGLEGGTNLGSGKSLACHGANADHLADHPCHIAQYKQRVHPSQAVIGKHAKGGNAGSGTTGLPNAGAASDEGKTLKHWREIAGLTDDDDTKKEG